MRDGVNKADSPLSERLIIDVKVFAVRLGCGCNGCREKLHLHFLLGYDIIKLKNRSELISTFSTICVM